MNVQIFRAVSLEYEIVFKVLEGDGRQMLALWLRRGIRDVSRIRNLCGRRRKLTENVVECDIVDGGDFEGADSSYAAVWREKQTTGEGLEVAEVITVLGRAESARSAGLSLGGHVDGGGEEN